MAKQPIAQRFQTMIAELKRHPAIQVTVADIRPPATHDELAAAGGRLPLTPAMIEFYSQANGIQVQWERRGGAQLPDGGMAAGFINLLPVQQVFGDWENVTYFGADSQYRKLYPLDFFRDEACAALLLDGSQNPQIYYYYIGEEMRPLGVDFAGYLELLLKARGFWYWQVAVAARAAAHPADALPVEERNFRALMPQLFPDYHDSDFTHASG